MFRIPRVNVVESDEGFSVEVMGRTRLRYTQGDKTLLVDCEIQAYGSPIAIVIFKSSIQNWGPPYDKDLIDNATRDIIIDNIRRAFAFEGHKIDVGY